MKHDLRCAIRAIWSHRWFSAAVVVTLALGIGLNTMVFTLINAVLFKPVPVPGGSRLVSILDHNAAQPDRHMGVSYPDYLEYRAQSRSFESLQATEEEGGILSEPGNSPQSYHLELASAGIFSMLHTEPVLGRGFTASDDLSGADPVLVIAYGVWQERYALAANVIGRKVRVNGKPATVIGVMPNGFRFPTGVDLWMSLPPTADLLKRENRPLLPYAILKPGVSLQQAQAELGGIAARLARQYTEDKDTGASVLTFQQRFNGGQIRLIFLLMLGAVGFVLLIACADVSNMMLSRALDRQREMAIRSALGASRWRMMRQLLVESLFLSAAGGLLGLTLATLGVRWFDQSTVQIRPFWIQFTPDYTVLGYFSALCIFSVVLFGTLPALRSSRPNLSSILSEGARSFGRRRGGWLSSVLVVFQFALTLVLLTGAGIFLRSLFAGLEVNPFIPARQLWTARLELPNSTYKDTDARERFYEQLLPRLRALPGVTSAAVTSMPPGLGGWDHQVELEHKLISQAAQRPSVALVACSPGYFDTIHLPLLRGRDFTSTDGSANHDSAILTKEAADRFWPGQDPIGKRFRVYDEKGKAGNWITVVGVSAGVNQEVVSDDAHPAVFIPYRQAGWDNMAIMVASSTDPIPAVRTAVQAIDQDLPLTDIYRFDQAVQHQIWFLRLFGELFFGFALVGLIMASIGVYAVMAHAAAARTREIGVRIALGASARNILSLIMSRGIWQIGAGIALGLAAGYPVARLMATLPLGVSTTSTGIFFTVAAVLAFIGVFACWIPARRAARLDPVKAIRYE
ncbi:MAG TPA: ABC transporter permease [Terracidiphilus sp.]|jgi:predicted permease|nr:ABC transporter permease [Terracidiphilus sp.]